MRRNRLVQVLVALVVVAGAAACGGDDGETDEASGTAAESTTTTDGITSTSAPDESTSTTSVVDEDADGPIVVLVPGALGIVTDSGSGSTTQLTFGEATLEQTTTGLTAALGDPSEEIDLAECGEGPLHSVRFPSLATYFADDVLQGWHLQSTTPFALSTANGITIGSTKAELEEAFPDVSIDETSLGIEFTVGTEGETMSGTLVEDAPDGKIDALWSGMVCIAR